MLRACALAIPILRDASDCISRPFAPCRARQTYGLLIYERLGPSSQEAFAQTWGVGVGLDNAQQWKDVAHEALKAALIMVLLERLRITRGPRWLEGYADFVSVQALLFEGRVRNIWQQTQLLVHAQRRIG